MVTAEQGVKGERALVLGGGGITGIAWQTGFLAGLASQGVDIVSNAGLVVGTSAGSTVAGQILSGRGIAALYHDQIDGTAPPEPHIDVDMIGLIRKFSGIVLTEPDPIIARKTIGAMALAQDRTPEAERRDLIARRLPGADWPVDQDLRVAVVDAATGEFRALGREDGVDLVTAVSASCAIPEVWPAVTIGDARYVDGGIRSDINADLAQGWRRVITLECMETPQTKDVKPLSPPSEELRIKPNAESLAAMVQILDPDACPRAAKAAFAQAVEMASEVSAFWG